MSNKEDGIIKNYLEKVKLIEKYNKSYYDKDAPTISDHKYDAFKKETLDLEKKFLFLKNFGSINNRIGLIVNLALNFLFMKWYFNMNFRYFPLLKWFCDTTIHCF